VPAAAPAASRGPVRRRPRLALAAGVALLLAAAAAPLTLWMADSEVSRAGDVFAQRPAEALDRLDRAAALNPFSARPDGVAGSVALRYGDLPRADRAFARVLRRVPDDQYATLERGAIASASGRPAVALTLLARAVRLAPRDRLTREALAVVRSGGVIDVTNLNRRILLDAQKLGR
jgi:tetratricopeptide (TPR) repeat protein